MMRPLRVFGAFVLAALITYGVAAVAASQSAINAIVALGLPVTMTQRWLTTSHDLVGMSSIYLPVLSIGLAIALAVASAMVRRWPSARWGLMACAGFVSVLVVNIALKMAFDITPIAASRTFSGLLVQGLAGFLGGAFFASASAPRSD